VSRRSVDGEHSYFMTCESVVVRTHLTQIYFMGSIVDSTWLAAFACRFFAGRVLSTRRSESSNISLVVSYRIIAVDENNQIATFLPPDRNMKHEVVFIFVDSRENDPGLKLQRFWLFPGEHVPAEMSVRSRRLEDWIL